MVVGAFFADNLVTARVVGLDADAPSPATAGVLPPEDATPGGVTGAAAEVAAVANRSDCLAVVLMG